MYIYIDVVKYRHTPVYAQTVDTYLNIMRKLPLLLLIDIHVHAETVLLIDRSAHIVCLSIDIAALMVAINRQK